MGPPPGVPRLLGVGGEAAGLQLQKGFPGKPHQTLLKARTALWPPKAKELERA